MISSWCTRNAPRSQIVQHEADSPEGSAVADPGFPAGGAKPHGGCANS